MARDTDIETVTGDETITNSYTTRQSYPTTGLNGLNTTGEFVG